MYMYLWECLAVLVTYNGNPKNIYDIAEFGYQTAAVNDPFGHPTVLPAMKIYFFGFGIDFENWGQMNDMCEINYYYWP